MLSSFTDLYNKKQDKWSECSVPCFKEGLYACPPDARETRLGGYELLTLLSKIPFDEIIF